jgi:hypothetical protein
MLNLASMIRSQGAKKTKRVTKFKYQANKTQVLAKTKDFILDLILMDKIRPILKQLLKLLDKRKEAVRPNRSNPRIDSTRRRLKGLNSKGI